MPQFSFPRARDRSGVHVGRDHGIGWLGILGTLALGPYLANRYGGVDGVRICLLLWAFSWTIWVAVLRPRVSVEGATVVLVNGLRDVKIPAAAVEDVRLGAYLRVVANGRTYTTAAIGTSRRQYRRRLRGRTASSDDQNSPRIDEAALLVDSVLRAAHQARSGNLAASEVVATWAAAPILVLLGLCLAAIVTLAF